MGLQYADLAAVRKADMKTKRIDLNDRTIIEDPNSWDRLLEEKIIEDSGQLTEKGIKLAESLVSAEKQLVSGIPFWTRERKDPKAMLVPSDPKWNFMVLTKRKAQLVTNGEMLYVGRPVQEMGAVRIPADQVKKIGDVLRGISKYKSVDAFPHTFQVSELGGVEAIWLADEKQERFGLVQAKYFDFIQNRFPSAEFSLTESAVPVLLVKVTNHGIKGNLVAVVGPIDQRGAFEKPPKKLDGWEAKINEWRMQRKGVPPLEEENRGAV